jgi:hypothetical protein
MMKNRYMSNLEPNVVPARQQALHAYMVSKALDKHLRVLMDYVHRLLAMQSWISNTADIVIPPPPPPNLPISRKPAPCRN